jgi:hypothetical protein
MSFRTAIQSGTGTWSIALATHFDTAVKNETTDPALALSGVRAKREDAFRAKYAVRRPPVAGYNCFGHIFALRRTALYDFDTSVLETILDEDGYGEVHEAAVGDVVVYFDTKLQPFHAGRVVRFDRLFVGLASNEVAIVLSKFDDVSGEYEHKIDEDVWPGWVSERRLYRPWQLMPKRRTSWRDLIGAPP